MMKKSIYLVMSLAMVAVMALFTGCGNKTQCPLCSGSGMVSAQGNVMNCPICSGKGEISTDKYKEVTATKACSICNGTGAVGFMQCTICQGRGTCSQLQVHQWLCTPIERNEPEPDRPSKCQKELCPVCHGSGRCQTCDGMGYTTGFTLKDVFNCKACYHPGGQTYKGDGKCRHCQGTGMVTY